MTVDQFAPYEPPYMKGWRDRLSDPKPVKVKPAKPRKKGKRKAKR